MTTFNRSFKVVISSNFDNLAAENVSATVEAEYGDRCVEGSVVTMAHHGPRAGQPCPCLFTMNDELRAKMDIEGWNIGVSHLDLDTIGGIASLLGCRPGWVEFWQAAAHVDVNGPHRLCEYLSTLTDHQQDLVRDQLNAYWAWSQSNRCFPPRDGSVMDVTDQVRLTLDVLGKIFMGDKDLVDTGKAWAEGEARLNGESLRRVIVLEEGPLKGQHIAVRAADRFVNHLYGTCSGVAIAVVALNTKFGSVTVSRESENLPFNCREFVQAMWGSEAGGHDGIAGGPRGKEMGELELEAASATLAEYLEGRKDRE